MSADRSYLDILSEVERWAQQKIRDGDERVYLQLINELRAEDTDMKRKTEVSRTEPPPKKNEALPIVNEEWRHAMDLPTLKSLIENCTKCPLHKTRTNFVFGVGNPNAKVMVIGEAPGADEDKKGEPFVGRAGQLLDKMLLAINFPREEVFIANILKSRPPGNRDPLPSEVEACEPYLWKQIDIIKPKMILCVGRIAGTNLLKNGIDTLAGMRGKVFDFRGAKVMVTYHPAALLRNPNWKHGAWEDLQKFRKLYDELVTDN
ncbi:MAG TPA: uracil-DNA glycosylase [Candidatus Kapabacteria bacterium]|nr:uracil-DNA glycosylase [Candidatus Kapabacteria bacterium]